MSMILTRTIIIPIRATSAHLNKNRNKPKMIVEMQIIYQQAVRATSMQMELLVISRKQLNKWGTNQF